MGDGSKQNEGLHLNTYGFNLEDIKLLVDALNKNFPPALARGGPQSLISGFAGKIRCAVHKHKTGMRIYITKKDLFNIKPLIIPHMHNTMLYKLGQ